MSLIPKSEIAKAIDTQKSKATYHSSMQSLLTEIAIVLIILILIFTFVFGITVQHGNDMYPAIKDGDIVLYYRTHNIVNTEAVVYRVKDETHIGRVEASAGAEINATSDLQLMVDGIYLPISKDDGIFTKTYAEENQKLPITIKDGHYFVLGDNRDIAVDSRTYGQISKKNVKGRIITVLRRRQI